MSLPEIAAAPDWLIDLIKSRHSAASDGVPVIETIGDCRLYLGDCMELLSELREADAIISDPPYGMKYKVNKRSLRDAGLLTSKGLRMSETEARPMIKGDDEPFDPTPWLAMPRVALFGANKFNSRLPDGTSWIYWDKRVGGKSDSHSDGELIFTNIKGADRIHRQLWRGVCRAGEENCSRSKKLHPNQKPVALLDRIFTTLDLKPGQTVIDPFMGSGSTGIVAVRRGLKFIGCEIDPKFYEIAKERLWLEQAIH